MNMFIRLIVGLVFSGWICYVVGYIVYKLDKHKESKELLGNLFLFGMISLVPSLILSWLFSLIFPNSLSFMHRLLAAFSEEISKWYIIYKFSKHIEFNETYDAVIYGVFTALGFAFFEDLFYILFSSDLKSLIDVGLLRTLTGPIGHPFYGFCMGYFILKAYKSKINNKNKEYNKYLLLSLFIPTAVHTAYNYLSVLTATGSNVFIKMISLILYIVLIVALYIIFAKLIIKESKNNMPIKAGFKEMTLPIKKFKTVIITSGIMTLVIAIISLIGSTSR